jgi:hypothetical protein
MRGPVLVGPRIDGANASHRSVLDRSGSRAPQRTRTELVRIGSSCIGNVVRTAEREGAGDSEARRRSAAQP